MAGYTPMMQQYLKIKAEYQDCFLFFRMGDFYELFFDDAIAASRELEITLTSRGGGMEEKIPMCGVPYHSSDNYIKVLVEKGFKVAICEQVEDPKEAKGVVKREVIRLVTPGTVMEGTMLDEKENNYLTSVHKMKDECFIVFYSDLSTGENSAVMIEEGWEAVVSELFNRPIKEVVIADDLEERFQESLQERLQATLSFENNHEAKEEWTYLYEKISQNEEVKKGFNRLLHYIQRTQKRAMNHLRPAELIPLNQYMALDMYSKRNLELTQTILRKGKHGSLLWVLDQTKTAMGARMLKKWVERPLLHPSAITERFNLVDGFIKQYFERETLRETLKSVYDIERLAGRVAFGNVNGKDLIQLKHSLYHIPEIKSQLDQFETPEVKNLGEQLDDISDLYTLLDTCLVENPPLTIKEGGLIKDNFHSQLDEYRDASRNGKKWITELEKQEKEETKIRSLKIGYNRVFGYYIEVTKANLHLLPEGKYERKQTLTNAERFITPELKEKESLILEAEEKSVELEYDLFIELRESVKKFIPRLQRLANNISRLDVLLCFASISEANRYIRPTFSEDRSIYIQESRHPVIEQVMKNETFVPNNIEMKNNVDMLLITGPNMSGKSTFMRQLALTSIMAQIGCFIPASQASLPVFDQIFTRIGAADDLVSGQSTFMVEMLEAKHAITQATENSLILLDEIGRGTSTYDGMALAQAIMEYIHDNVHSKTLFSTHYHELTAMEESLTRLKNVHVRAEEYQGNVVFLHQIKDGPADESYGIHVAKLADLPQQLIERATAILHMLEKKDKSSERKQEKSNQEISDEHQLDFFGEQIKEKPVDKEAEKLVKQLRKLDIMDMTPIEAMNELYQLQQQAKKTERKEVKR